MLGDRPNTQDQPLISPRHFEEFFLPCYQRVTEHCHELDLHCGIHCCGDIKMLIPLMMEAGLDFLQLDSPNMCGVDWLAENAAGKVCLFCSVDIQEVYPTNDPRIIERYIKDMIAKLADHQGGFVAWPYSEPAVILVGVGAVRLERRLFKKLGRYPLDFSLLRDS